MDSPKFGFPCFSFESLPPRDTILKQDNSSSNDSKLLNAEALSQSQPPPISFSRWSYTFSPFWNTAMFHAGPTSANTEQWISNPLARQSHSNSQILESDTRPYQESPGTIISDILRPTTRHEGSPANQDHGENTKYCSTLKPAAILKEAITEEKYKLANGDAFPQHSHGAKVDTQPSRAERKDSIKLEEESMEEGELRDSETDNEPHPGITGSTAQATSPCRRTLGSLDLKALSENQILFYYGVLAIQMLLLPRFKYQMSGRTDRWGVTLTMYGHTISTAVSHETQMAAKIEACLTAIKRLQSPYHEWTVPCDTAADTDWDWIRLLNEHCIHNGLPAPTYTKCVFKKDRLCYEIELLGVTYLGPADRYEDKFVAQNTAAHQTLYQLLVFGNGDDCNIPGPATLRSIQEDDLVKVPRSSSQSIRNKQGQIKSVRRRPHDHADNIETNNPSGREAKRCKITTQKRFIVQFKAKANKKQQVNTESEPKNSNLLPVSNCRLTPIETAIEKEPTRWRVTPQEIMNEMSHLISPAKKLEKICELLSLDQPMLKVDRVDGRLIESEGAYNVAAYFHGDPFLARAGAIGRLDNVFGTKQVVMDGCATRVVKYLINVVEEDTKLESENARRRLQRDEWWTTARKSNGCH